jgi:acetoin utilization protein AcuC
MFHTPRYLDAIIAAENGFLDHEAFLMGLGTPDCPVFKGMYDHAALASGGTVMGAQLILEGKAIKVFNPSGGFHHAHAELASGFCYINDIVLASMVLAEAGKRVLVIDVDVHHCDGVQSAFYGRCDVAVLSLHESGKTQFPGTGFENEIGEGAGEGYTVNVPLPPGIHDEAYLHAFEEVAVPFMEAFAPDVIVVELGLDGLKGDPLGHLCLTNNVYADIIELVMAQGKPILATGGGGYNVDITARGWALAWSVLCGLDHSDDMSVGMGGVMLESTEWQGGLRDIPLTVSDVERLREESQVAEVVETAKKAIFPIHGI